MRYFERRLARLEEQHVPLLGPRRVALLGEHDPIPEGIDPEADYVNIILLCGQ